MREVALPSGAVLKVQAAPIAAAKALYQASLAELRGISVVPSGPETLALVMKEMFCAGFSSPVVDACLEKCMARCLYDDVKIDKDTFEDENRRQDYVKVCAEVFTENVSPFWKSLFAEFKGALAMMRNIRL